MENKDGSRLGDEFQDGTGLELSLGLSLSSTDARQKWKVAEAASAPSSSSIDPAGESSTGTNINGSHTLVKQKAFNKPSGINTAIKKFLEWGLDYQDENSTLLDGSNGFGLDKEKERLLLADSHEKASQRLDISAPEAEGKGNPFLFKELQGSSVRASSRSQSPGQTTPLQLVDAFKDTPTSGSPGSAQGHCEFDEDDTNHEDSGPHKSFQDHQRKRKHLMDDHTQQKKGKSEETLHGFCGLGSHPMLNASNVDMGRSRQALRGDNSRGQIQDVTSQEEKDSAKAEKGQETNQDERPHCEKNIIGNYDQNEYGRTSEVNVAGQNVMSQFKAPDVSVQKTAIQTEDESTWHRSAPMSTEPMNVLERQNSVNKASAGSSLLKDRQCLVTGRNGDKASSPLHRMRDKVSSETSSVSTGGTDKVEEKTRSGEASSSVLEVASYKDPSSASIVTPPFCSPVTAISSAQVPYPVSPYPLVPAPYPVSVSMPHAHGMLFPTGVNFPYSMQFVPPGSEGSQQNVRPVGTNAFQHPGIEYPQLSPLEVVASRMPPVRPPVVSPFTHASNGALHNRNMMGVLSEDANAKLPALTRMHDSEVGNLPPIADPSLVQNHALFRASVHSGVHDQLAHMPALTAPAIPTVQHLPLHLGVSDHGDVLSLKNQNSTDSLRSFASVAIQQHMQTRNTTEPSSLGQEEFVRAAGSDFNHGSTENLLDGLGEDMAFLQFGIAPGLKFGGTGTAPNLPWVHVTGPNGQTINGVLYRVQRTQLKEVVCACHGKHMSPMEFAQHAGIVDVSSGDKNGGVNASPAPRG